MGVLLQGKVWSANPIADARVDQQLRQACNSPANSPNISPTACFQYAMEGLANYGIVSYISFVKQVRRYRNTFIDFIKTEDKSDPHSSISTPWERAYLRNLWIQRPYPYFKERISHQSAIFPLGLLILYNVLFFIAAQLSFLKCELK